MQDRSSNPSRHALQAEIGKILSAAADESQEVILVDPSSDFVSTPNYAIWRGAGLILALISAWPAGFPQALQSLIFVAACSCTLVALIQYMLLPSQAEKASPKLATLRRIV